MPKVTSGFDESQKGQRIENLPNTGTLTGEYFIDLHGCWWEYILDHSDSHPNGGCKYWIVGEMPSDQK